MNFSKDLVLSTAFDQLVLVRSKINQIQQAMGSASVATFHNGRVSWKQSKSSLRLDTTSLKADHPELIAPYFKSSAGSRRFLVQAA
ncbi:hypothetical protein P8S54_08135 [Thiomicrospira sp. R3]|uniref:hypothetical protein n=1 Tax=Thiomicrospira sp. R3 TaxID=3035472 RepID=UPI00259BCD0F|nr:hypothetical protein [Thiomicrospira sp. R3]WFE68182.1 hypothetical protein P8S54_08135 [Thiomicrospira sp. R3]